MSKLKGIKSEFKDVNSKPIFSGQIVLYKARFGAAYKAEVNFDVANGFMLGSEVYADVQKVLIIQGTGRCFGGK